MKSTILLALTLLAFCVPAIAQVKCGFDEVHQKRLKEDPVYRQQVEQQTRWIKEYISEKKRSRTNSTQSQQQSLAALYTIPVVVHVVHTGGAVGTIYNPTDIQIQNTINYLNQFYNGTYPGIEGVGDIQLQFTLAKLDPNCSPTTGINRVDGSGITNYTTGGVNVNTSGGTNETNVKNLVRWDPSRYYNIWVVNRIDGNDGTSGSFVAGFAYFPGAPSTIDGTIMLATQMNTGKKTLPHEIGHAFSVYHPFQGASGSTCPTNADCTNDGDGVCDTDPITQPAGFVCRTGTNSCTSTPYNINTEHNIMNYTNCSTLFTQGQKDIILAAAAGPFRVGLTTSRALSAVYPVTPFTPPVAASCTPATAAVGLSGSYTGILDMSIATRELGSGPTDWDPGYISASRCLNVVAPLTKGTTYNFSVTLLATNMEQLRIWMDFNNDGVFSNGAPEEIFYQNNISTNPWSRIVTGSFTVPMSTPNNTMIRMRLTNEVGTAYGAGFAISSACYNPTYGQAEDYPVYIADALSLPVKFEYFRGKPQGRDVILEWKTSYEDNSEKFVIERSHDGLVYHEIGQLGSKGDNGAGALYSFTDVNPGRALEYYRLRQIDRDGKSKLTNVVAIRFNDTGNERFKILNNPFDNSIEVLFDKPIREKVSIVLSDAAGIVLHTKQLMPDDQSRIKLDISHLNLKPGMYLLKITTSSEQVTQKLIKK